jgi:hypothetical protein
MPRDGAAIYNNLIGKLDAVQVTCERCGRKGRCLRDERREPVQAHVQISSEAYEGDRQFAVRSLGTTALFVLGSLPVLQVLRQEH